MSLHRSGYTLTVDLKGPRLSAANKRAVKRAAAIHGLFHLRAVPARKAAAELCKLNAVDCVHVDRVINRRVCTYMKGIRDQ